ncbi:hypothetical protein CVT25_004230 [Psilocybe cyanescens]|uniref:Transcription factor IIIC putative zinc-finger domain-containing protein n=1 Tax=Psilocybe cyanescens TaxID=93625 RepID=A0A409X313_PSICY|nr:hypothetical protein CVT25_004230 [Psilocybe cyanescens]
MIVQSLLPGCPPELTEEGKQLSLLIQPLVAASSPSASAAPDGFGAELNESCPACGVDVPLQDITTAVCANGHTWGIGTMLGDDVYLIDALGSNMYRVQS